MKPKPKVGDKLFSLNVGNAARRCEQKLTPVTVTRVGRKYFTCETDDRWKFKAEYHLDTWSERTEYIANSCLYESEQEWNDESDANLINSEIRGFFRDYGKPKCTLTQLRQIAAILGIKTTPTKP